MDPSIYLQYSPPTGVPPPGLPQESKLATYMNHAPTNPNTLSYALGKVSLDSSQNLVKKALPGEFVPAYYTPQLQDAPDNSPSAPLMTGPPPTTQVVQENVGGTTYFYSTSSDGNSLNAGAAALNLSNAMGPPELCMMMAGPSGAQVSPYASQLYTCPPPHMPPMAPMGPKPGLATTFYLPETIRSEIYQRNEDVFLQPDRRQYPELPEHVEMYAELTSVESVSALSLTSSYRATHRQQGDHYALRRLHSYGGIPAKRLELWKQIDHPNIVRFYDCFTTTAFGDHSLMMVYDYHPGCSTLLNKFLADGAVGAPCDANSGFHDPFSSDPDAPRPYTHQKNAMLRAVACGALLPEAELWSMLVQLTSALRTIHATGLACRNLDPSKVIMNGCRVRIAWGGVSDALHGNANDVTQGQQEDLTALGRLALALACRTIHCDNLPACMDLVARTYSADLKNLILYLLSTSSTRRYVTDLMPMIGARFYTQVEALEKRADAFEDQLAIEIDNSRLLRILIKLGVINERPEFNMDPAWAETGGRYMLKLFRDYLFHAVTEDGRPWLDQAHLVYCLNQLDSGTNTRVWLMSRDEQSALVVSYAELKHCLEQAYDDVSQVTSEQSQ